MFGKNPQAPNCSDESGQYLPVREIFHSVQGEGPSAGTPAIFIRLGGCNLKCTFCDTDFDEERSEVLSPLEIMQRLGSTRGLLGSYRDIPLVVITGGEPLRHNLAPLLRQLQSVGWRNGIEIETAGTLIGRETAAAIDDATDDSIRVICSPKTPHVNPGIAERCTAYKYIVQEGDQALEQGVPYADTQGIGRVQPLYFPHGTAAEIFVQPMDAYRALPGASFLNQRFGSDIGYIWSHGRTYRNHQYAAQVAMRWGYRVSIQMHKLLNLA